MANTQWAFREQIKNSQARLVTETLVKLGQFHIQEYRPEPISRQSHIRLYEFLGLKLSEQQNKQFGRIAAVGIGFPQDRRSSQLLSGGQFGQHPAGLSPLTR